VAGSNIVAARVALIAALDALVALDGVPVTYSYAAKNADLGNREYIYGGGKSEAAVAQAAMKGSARVKRIEEPDWTLHVRVAKPGETTTQAGDTRAMAIGAEIENYLAASPTLGGAVTGLINARITGWTLTSWTDEKQSNSELDYSLAFESYLT
jgi:hypothetical protein